MPYHVHARTQHVALDELGGVAAGDGLDLADTELTRVDFDASLCTSERDVDDGALVGHERGEGHHLLLINMLAVPDAALAGQTVVAVLNAESLNDHRVVLASLLIDVDSDREFNAQKSSAFPDVGFGEEFGLLSYKFTMIRQCTYLGLAQAG